MLTLHPNGCNIISEKRKSIPLYTPYLSLLISFYLSFLYTKCRVSDIALQPPFLWSSGALELVLAFRHFQVWFHSQVVKTSPFHGEDTGSNPVGIILHGYVIVPYLDLSSQREIKWAAPADGKFAIVCNILIHSPFYVLPLYLLAVAVYGPLAQLVRASGS